jgi:TfoX/Sxy family transcriptional regulator of competence genes
MTDERWHELVEGAVGGSVTPGTMFGSKGLRTGKKFFAIWWHDQVVVKLPPARIEAIVGSGEAFPFEPMSGRRMNGWVVLAPTADAAALVTEAHAFVDSQNR